MSRNQLYNLKFALKGLLLMAIILIGCQDDEPTAVGCTNAKLVDATGLERCSWLIELLDGTRLEPTNLNDFDLTLTDNLPVCVEFVETNNIASTCMAGIIVEITSIEEGQ